MATIFNNTQYTFSTGAQQEINNAAANMGLDEVNAVQANGRVEDNTLYDFYDNDDNYIFSIDVQDDCNVVYHRG